MKRKLLKALAVLACLALSVGAIGCGGKDNGSSESDSSAGEISPMNDWEAAWEYMLTATNLSVSVELTYEQENFNGTYTGIMLLADGKLYVETEFEGSGEYTDEEDRLSQHYVGIKDGTPYEWYKGDNMDGYKSREAAWLESYGEEFATGYMLFNGYSEFSIGDRYDYKTWESKAVYEYGVYTVFGMDGEREYSHKFSFVDNKLYSIESDSVAEWGSKHQKYIISYGDAVIGELPEL